LLFYEEGEKLRYSRSVIVTAYEFVIMWIGAQLWPWELPEHKIQYSGSRTLSTHCSANGTQ